MLVSGVEVEVSKSPTQPQRLDGLDVLRFILSIAVMGFHYLYYGPHSGVVDGTPLGHAWSYLRFAVESFFILSGFVIARSIDKRSRFEFAQSRIVRLLPAIWICALITHIAALTIASAGQPQPTLRGFLVAMTFVPLAVSVGGCDWSYWSLSYELRFYIYVGLGLLWLRSSTGMFRAVCGWMVLSVVALAFPITSRVVLSPFSAFFIVGCLLHLLRLPDFPRQRALVALVVAAGIAVAQVLAESATKPDFIQVDVLEAVGIVLVSCALVVGAAHVPPLPAKVASFIKLLGGASYPLYLLHQLLGYYLMQAAISAGMPMVASAAIAALICIALSAVIALVLEPRLAQLVRAMVQYFGREGRNIVKTVSGR